MSLATLLTQDITILHHTPGAEDDHGNAAHAWVADPQPVKGFLQPRVAQEVTLDRQTVVSDWLLFLHKDVVITSRDRVLSDIGQTFEVLTVAPQPTPRGISHLEVGLRHFA